MGGVANTALNGISNAGLQGIPVGQVYSEKQGTYVNPSNIGQMPTMNYPVTNTGVSNQAINAPRLLPNDPITISAADQTASQVDASIRPFLTQGLQQAQEIFLRQQPSFYPG